RIIRAIGADDHLRALAGRHETLTLLRLQRRFAGGLDLQPQIPEASPRLIEEAGLHADRLSLNIELPTDNGITRFAPEKKPANIRRS
ncbi:hypothetical protein AB9F46_35355, partial [Rhizobium leguminosarum]